MMPAAILEVCQALIRRPGYWTVYDIEAAEMDARAFPHAPARPMLNAKPERWKYCPLCYRSQPISEYLLPTTEVRTVILFHREAQEEFAYPVANISEYCRTCGDDS